MSIERMAVIGAGTMGNGIAQVCALAGLEVTLIDVAPAALDRGRSTIEKNLQRQMTKGVISEVERATALSRISTTTDSSTTSKSDLVIEAATEDVNLKLRLLRQIGEQLKPGALMASNTSSISITQLAAATPCSDRFMGVHFFNPVPMMALVELIRGVQTTDSTAAAMTDFVRRIGKTPIAVRNAPAFVVNRLLCPMINEAFCALGDGVASAEEIDEGMKLGCGHPIGPLALADLIGLDTLLAIMEVLHADFGDSKYRPAWALRELVAAGRLGRKTQRGVYEYQA
ncbi:MAG: paaH1 [Ramlibacter sp.]|jgi:3-hydroxybutyryl-CoA dehydrogenase|nr:paaH1 [Ramlibacter sp.]